MFQQTTFIILTSPSDGSFQSPRVGAGCHCLALQACHQVTSAQFQGVEASGQGRAADARGEDQIIQCEQGAVEVSHGDCGAFSRLNRRSEFRGFVGRNHARHPVMLRFSFLCFLLEQSYSNKMLSNGALHVMTVGRTKAGIKTPATPVMATRRKLYCGNQIGYQSGSLDRQLSLSTGCRGGRMP